MDEPIFSSLTTKQSPCGTIHLVCQDGGNGENYWQLVEANMEGCSYCGN